MKIINIVIFSRLQSYGGGRETWLNNFLKVFHEDFPKYRFVVHYIIDSESDNKMLISALKDQNINFIGVKIGNSKNKLDSIFRIFYFTICVVRNILKQKYSSDSVAIGSLIEPLPIYITKIFSKRKTRMITWLRGIIINEHSHRHNMLSISIINMIESFLIKKSDLVIANGYDTAKHYYDKLKVKIDIIPNSIFIEDFQKHATTTIKKEKITISYIGRLSLEKGFKDYIDAIKQYNLTKSTNKIQFEVVGNGPLEYLLAEPIEGLKYHHMIANDKIPEYLQSIDCGVALTKSEKKLGGAGISNGLLELMASEKVIICWNNQIFTQILDSQSAVLIEESDVVALVSAFQLIADAFPQLTSLGTKARKISESYSFNEHKEKFLKLIN